MLAFALLFFCLITNSIINATSYEKLKVLHMTFHTGCQKDFETIAEKLGFDLTSWYIHDDHKRFEGTANVKGDVYNINPNRANRVWQKNKDFFDKFDIVVTSDTAPLARIFLQNNWQKPLIIWVCNRFDYASVPAREMDFPDKEYYNIFTKATTMPNVHIISYTPYEYIYALKKGINIGTKVIKPVGSNQQKIGFFSSFIPKEVNQDKTLFLFPRLEPQKNTHVQQQCAKAGIPIWTGKYNGPNDLIHFKGVLFFPYAYSNLALFENLQRGIVHFVPTKQFLLQLGYIWDASLKSNLDWCEWYSKEYEHCIVYFDSWLDLQSKIASTNYEKLKQEILETGAHHRNQTLSQWQSLFEKCMPK